MENKEPKEIWVHNTDIKELRKYCICNKALIHSIIKGNIDNSEYIKYLSETQVKELLSDKDKEIRDLLKLVAEINAEIAKKDIQIYKLKIQLEK